MAPIPPIRRSASRRTSWGWGPTVRGEHNKRIGRHAEDEDEARSAQAVEAHGVGQADARRWLEAAQARGQVAEAAAPPAQEEADRQSVPDAAASAGSLPISGSL